MKTGNSKSNFETRKLRNFLISIFLSALILLSGFSIIAWDFASGDGGYIEYEPFKDFSVYEPGQKAIVAWNGNEEILILSVDVLSSGNTKVLHMVPIPALPTLSLGNISSFETINDMIDDHGYNGNGNDGSEAEGEGEGGDGFTIEFHEQIGPHNLTVIHVNSSKEFTAWVKNYLQIQGVENVSFLDGTQEVIEHYITKNINYFVFDEIEISNETKSVDPIIYRFKSNYLYYPLVISSIIEGVSQINVITITPENLPLNTEDMRKVGFKRSFGFKISHSELVEIDSNLAELIPDKAYLHYYSDIFPLEDLKHDIMMGRMNDVTWMKTFDWQVSDIKRYDCNKDGLEDVILFSNYNLYALDHLNGNVIWEVDFGKYWLHELRLIDVNSDGVMELIAISKYYNSRDNQYVHYEYEFLAIDTSSGDLLWSCKTNSPDRSGYHCDISKITDIDSDGKLDLVYFTEGANFIAINLEDGSVVWALEILEVKYGNILDFEILDLDQDGTKEIIISTTKEIVVLNGKLGFIKWKKRLHSVHIKNELNQNILKCINDFDSDGVLEILVLRYNFNIPDELDLLDGADGSLEWTYNCKNKNIGTRSSNIHGWAIDDEFGFFDLDLDNKLEILWFRSDGVYAINSEDGSFLWDLPDTPDLYPKRSFVVYDVDSDKNSEIIYSCDNTLCVIEGENGDLKWRKTLEDDYSYFITDHLINDVDNDNDIEIIIDNYHEIKALNAETGELEWNKNFFGYCEIKSDLMDFDRDGFFEIIVYSGERIYQINCVDGTIKWNHYSEDYYYYNNLELEDIDKDGNLEIIIINHSGFYILNPITGNIMWKFKKGELFHNYFPIFYTTQVSKDSIAFAISDRIYFVKPRELNVTISPESTDVKPGETLSFLMYVGEHDSPVSGVNFQVSDNYCNGIFSNLREFFPGFYEFDYTISSEIKKNIKVSIEATHPNYFGVVEEIILNVIDTDANKTSSSVSANLKNGTIEVETIAFPLQLKPGETTTILFRILTKNRVPFSEFYINLYDDSINGSFSTLSWYDSEYLKFTYTVPTNVTGESITILILASHISNGSGIGLVRLNITSNTEYFEEANFPDPVIDNNESKEEKLSINVTTHPSYITPGDKTVFVIYLSMGSTVITEADLEAFDKDLGGTTTKVMNHGTGHFSFIYIPPEDIPKQIKSAVLFLYGSYINQSTFFTLVELPVIHIDDEIEQQQINDFNLFIYAYPNRVYPGEVVTLNIWLTGTPDSIPVSNITIELSDDDLGGQFSLISQFEDRVVYEYKVPVTDKLSIEIFATAYYEEIECEKNLFNLKVIPERQNENEQINSNTKESADNIKTWLLISGTLIIILVVIMISIISYLRYKQRKITIQKNGDVKLKFKNKTRKLKLDDLVKKEIV